MRKWFLKELTPFIWVGGTPSTVEADLILDVHDFFRAPLPKESIQFLDADLLETAWQWFLPFSGQIMRWGIRSKHSIETLSERFVHEVAGQTYFLKKYGIKSVHCHSDPHRGRDYLVCKLAGALNIPVYTYSTINVGHPTFIQTELGQRLDKAVLVPEHLRTRHEGEINLEITLPPGSATSKSTEHTEVRSDSDFASASKQFELVFAPTNFFGRLRIWLRRQYVTPRSKFLGVRFFQSCCFDLTRRYGAFNITSGGDVFRRSSTSNRATSFFTHIIGRSGLLIQELTLSSHHNSLAYKS